MESQFKTKEDMLAWLESKACEYIRVHEKELAQLFESLTEWIALEGDSLDERA